MANTPMCQSIAWHISVPYGSAMGTPKCQNAPCFIGPVEGHGEHTNATRQLQNTRVRQSIPWHTGATGAPECQNTLCHAALEAHDEYTNVPEHPLAHWCHICVCDGHTRMPERPVLCWSRRSPWRTHQCARATPGTLLPLAICDGHTDVPERATPQVFN